MMYDPADPRVEISDLSQRAVQILDGVMLRAEMYRLCREWNEDSYDARMLMADHLRAKQMGDPRDETLDEVYVAFHSISVRIFRQTVDHAFG